MRKGGWKRLSRRRAIAVVCVSIICPPACPSYPPALPLSARASLPPFISMILVAAEAEASFPLLLPHCKAQREIASSTPQTFQAGSVRNLSHRRSTAPPLSLCQNCRYFAFRPSLLASVFCLGKYEDGDENMAGSATSAVLPSFHNFFGCIAGCRNARKSQAGLGKFGAIGITNGCAPPALGILFGGLGSVRQIYRLISSVGTRSRTRGREREVTDYFGVQIPQPRQAPPPRRPRIACLIATYALWSKQVSPPSRRSNFPLISPSL